MVLLIGFMVLTVTLNAYAHSGRTDSSGGHKDNRNASGLGGYHYHHGMGPHLHPNGVCPYAAPKVPPTPPVVTVSNVKINDGVGTLLIGENKSLSVAVSPWDAADKSVTWSSSDSDVATVSSVGLITAKNSGTATITAKSNNGKTDTFSLTVNKPVESVLIGDKDVTLIVGEDKTLSAAVSPADAANKLISWSSSDPKVATVSGTGVITAVSSGMVNITAKAHNDKFHAITISIKEKEVPVAKSDDEIIEEQETVPAMSTGTYLVSTLENNKGKSIAGFGFIGALTALGAYYKINSKR
jgi:uncharacterized protein YjdB